jgi:hypothetical protein
MQRNVVLNDVCLATEILLSGNFVNGKNVHIAYGYCDGTKKYKRLMQENVQCRNVLREF